jgi:hypothetical protein
MHQFRMSRELHSEGGGHSADRKWRRCALVLVILLLPGLLGAWRIMSGDTIDPNRVKRIQDGKTTKQEILVMFGDPQEIDRTSEGVTYIYRSYKDAPAMPYKWEDRKINPQSDQLLVIDPNKQIQKAPLKTKGEILRSTLLIRFKPDRETVLSHEYKEY